MIKVNAVLFKHIGFRVNLGGEIVNANGAMIRFVVLSWSICRFIADCRHRFISCYPQVLVYSDI
jgi:hypothetical protein